MDSLIPLILIALLYILPELFKKGRNKKAEGEYEYPKFPDETQPRVPKNQTPPPVSQPDLGYGYEHDYHIPLPTSAYENPFNLKLSEPVRPPVSEVSRPSLESVPANLSSGAPLQGVLSPKIITTGIIFSEIIMKPRAYRPFNSHYNPKV